MREQFDVVDMRIEHISEFGRMIAAMVSEAPHNFTITREAAIEYGSNQAFMIGMRKAITENKVGRYVALDASEKIVGGVTTSRKDFSLRIGNLFVLPRARTLGVGALLIDACEYRAVQDKIASTTLEVGSANANARKFFERLGYAAFDPPVRQEWQLHPGIYGELLVKDLSVAMDDSNC